MQKNINSELLQLQKSGLSAGFKASLATLVALHLLILLSSGFFEKIFLDGKQFILVVQTIFIYIFISIISGEFFKWQIGIISEQHSKDLLYANTSFLKQTVFKGAHITSFILLVEIAIMLRFGAPILEKTPDTFGYLGLVLFVSTPFFLVATYLAAKNGFRKWPEELEQGK
ncbi:MAG: hypothetical protein UV24_C0037G0002 [Candidatus Nomurabacteria bacterium GW2011_GWA2_42_41]|nr:MAG: hypothetical protein UV24_C0037G0002 [Candidatus Nomurabacteria bacterium GW2011_GWA2_42_41]